MEARKALSDGESYVRLFEKFPESDMAAKSLSAFMIYRWPILKAGLELLAKEEK